MLPQGECAVPPYVSIQVSYLLCLFFYPSTELQERRTSRQLITSRVKEQEIKRKKKEKNTKKRDREEKTKKERKSKVSLCIGVPV